ncbi:poly polymerase catalytic domain-containing protein [Mariannaea sp. PMI_226]|nr:poly polymerase catalytic domain-containing protein [Mariannaea sp. PMI_226]
MEMEFEYTTPIPPSQEWKTEPEFSEYGVSDPLAAIPVAPQAADAPDDKALIDLPKPCHQRTPSVPPEPPEAPRQPAPPLRRIVSENRPESGIVECFSVWHVPLLEHYETQFQARDRSNAVRADHTSPHGYFRWQTDGNTHLHIPVDDIASPGSTVLVDNRSKCIYDAYFLRTNIAQNMNQFRRQQVVYSPDTRKYSLLIREGRVGYPGVACMEIESTDPSLVVDKFRRLFKRHTQVAWFRRYLVSFTRDAEWKFIELNYREASTSTRHSVKLPNYGEIHPKVPIEVKVMMELALYGQSLTGPSPNDSLPSDGTTPRSSFTAPYELLSPYTIYIGFKILECMWKYLKSGQPLNWRHLHRISSWYASHIPCCSGKDRPPVLSSYPTIFLELTFLYSLHPWRELGDLLAEARQCSSLQLQVHAARLHPLYQAYSSLRHGFRRLTDPSRLEFQEVRCYLENSCFWRHKYRVELLDIYQVFVKANATNPYAEWLQRKKQDEDFSGEEKLLLWYGVPTTSVMRVLEKGPSIPHFQDAVRPHFGNGIYFADVASKSVRYCNPDTRADREGVLFLCEVDVGKERLKSSSNSVKTLSDIERSEGRRRCVEAQGRVRPAEWKMVRWEMAGLPKVGEHDRVLMPDASIPYNEVRREAEWMDLTTNEYVIYDPTHVLIRYLCRVKALDE